MLNNVERGLSKQHTEKVKNFPGAKTEIISEKLENPLESKPDMLIVHVGTNHLPKNINPLNNLAHSFPMQPFYTPCKYQKTLQFSDVFRG